MVRSRKRSASEPETKGGLKKKRRTISGDNNKENEDVLKDGSVLCRILTKAGITLKTSNTANLLSKDQAVFQRDFMTELKRHPDFPQVVEELTENLVKHIEDPVRLRWSLTPCIVPSDCDASSAGGTQDSMMRLLLGIEQLQTSVMTTLLEKLAEFTGDDDIHLGEEGVNIPKLIMSQFRWLDRIVDGKELVEKLFEVQSITPTEVQREMITSLPEVVDDSQHAEVARKLKELLVTNNQLAVPILDAMSNLTLRPDLVSEVRGSVVETLPSAELDDLPVIVKFMLQTVTNADDAMEVVTDLRKNLDFEADARSKGNKHRKNGSARGVECLVMDVIKSAVRFQRCVAEAWIKALDSSKGSSDHTVLDICVLYLLHSHMFVALDSSKGSSDHTVLDICVLYILHSCNYKKPVESLLRNKIRAGYICERLLSKTFKLHGECLTPVLIQSLIRIKIRTGLICERMLSKTLKLHGEVLRDYFPCVLSVAEVLLRSPEPTISYLACSMYKHAFNSFDTFCQQEIVGNLVTHIGSGFAAEIDSSLHILDDLVQTNIAKMAPFTIFVKGVLDYLDNLSVLQIRKLYSMLSALAFKNPREEGMIQDEMHIIIRKQLSNNKPKYKRMGVIGAIMVVNSLAQASSIENLEEASDGANTTISSGAYKQVINLLQLVRASSSKSPDAAALFMDELAGIIAKGIIDPRVEGWIADNVISDFQDDFVVDIDPEKRECTVVLPMSLQMGLDDESEGAIAINLLPLLVRSKDRSSASPSEDRKVSPTFLAPNFRLLQVCEKRQNNGSLEGVDALLGCPIHMAKKESLEKFSSLSNKEKELFCEVTFHCINWLRESVNAFSSQPEVEMKAKVIARLQNITDLQDTLKQALPDTHGFVPPTACFDIDESTQPVVSVGNSAGTSGVKRAKKPPAKKRGKKKDNKENDSQADNLDETSRDSTQDETVVETQVNKTDDSGDKQGLDLNKYRQFFREFDLDVFGMLKVGLITRAALDTELNTKDTTTLQIQPPQLQLLLEDLYRKLDHALPASANKKKMFLKVRSDKNLGFSILDQLSSVEVAKTVIDLLPALCGHLESTNAFFQALIATNDGMRDGPGYNTAEAQLMASCFHLLLNIMLAFFSWNGFTMPEHRQLLKDGLGVLASRMNTTTTSQLPLQDLLKQSFQYLENFSATISQLSCAVTLCKLVACVSQHTDSTQLHAKIGEMCHEFVKREWLSADGERAKGAKHNEYVQSLLKLYFAHTEDRLSALEKIASVGIPELVQSDKKDGYSNTYSSLTRNSYTTFYRCLLSELVDCIKPMTAGKQSDSDEVKMGKLLKWNMAVRIFHILVNLIKIFDARSNLGAVLKYGRIMLESFVKHAMPMVDTMFRSHKDDVQGLLKNLQISTRALHHMCGHLKIIKDVSLTNQVPLVKKCLETFVYRVKACLTMNSCLEAFWLGNLKNRDLKGDEIVQSQQSTVTDSTVGEDSDGSLPDDDSDSDVEVDAESVVSNDAVNEQSYSETY